MATLLKFSGIITKVKAMSSNLLTTDDYIAISQSTHVLDVANYLKKHPAYADAFANLDERLLHRGDIEKILVQSLYSDYSKLYRFGDPYVRKFLLSYLRRYEIDLINYCFRIVFNEYPEPFDLSYKREFFDKYSRISVDKLITATTIDDLVAQLEGTEYYAPLIRLQNSTNATLFDYNLALDLYYYTSVWKNVKKFLSKDELEIFLNQVGSKIDLLNLQWIYHGKKFYDMPAADIYAMLIPINYHLHKDILKELVEAPTVEDYEKILPQTYYGKQFSNPDAIALEYMSRQYLMKCYKKDSRKSPYSLAPINLYLYQKEEEIKKITTALECIRYEIDSIETLKYIGGTAQ